MLFLLPRCPLTNTITSSSKKAGSRTSPSLGNGPGIGSVPKDSGAASFGAEDGGDDDEGVDEEEDDEGDDAEGDDEGDDTEGDAAGAGRYMAGSSADSMSANAALARPSAASGWGSPWVPSRYDKRSAVAADHDLALQTRCWHYRKTERLRILPS
jgi:hypothetical protein